MPAAGLLTATAATLPFFDPLAGLPRPRLAGAAPFSLSLAGASTTAFFAGSAADAVT